MIANLGVPEAGVLVAIVLLLFGGKKIPELAKSLGQGIRLFKGEVAKQKDEIQEGIPDGRGRVDLPRTEG